MQHGQPVAYASQALTMAETRYAQIEKELLAIVFACNRFEAYIYGIDVVHVETDHKPLESIMLKPLNSAPKSRDFGGGGDNGAVCPPEKGFAP